MATERDLTRQMGSQPVIRIRQKTMALIGQRQILMQDIITTLMLSEKVQPQTKLILLILQLNWFSGQYGDTVETVISNSILKQRILKKKNLGELAETMLYSI